MSAKAPHLLIIEDDPQRIEFIRSRFSESGWTFELTCVAGIEDAQKFLSNKTARCHALLVGALMVQREGADSLQHLRQLADDRALLIFCASDQATLAQQAVKDGADDFLVLDCPEGAWMARIVDFSISRKNTQIQLREALEHYQQVVEQAPDAIFIINQKGRITDVNQPACDGLGYIKEELLALSFVDIHSPFDADTAKKLWSDISKGQSVTLEGAHHRKDGGIFPVEAHVSAFSVGKQKRALVVARDITDRVERRRAEQQVLSRRTEFEIARRVQRRLFPVAAFEIPQYDIYGSVHPASETSGDYYDYLDMVNGYYGVVIGDVSGHGLPAALTMVEIHAYLRALVRTYADPGYILRLVNRELMQNEQFSQFVSVCFVRLNPAASSFVYVGAGHQAWVVRASSDIELLDSNCMPLGISSTSDFVGSPAIDFYPNDLLLLVTDGVFETANQKRELWGEERMLQAVAALRHNSAREIVEGLFEEVGCFRKDERQRDDMAVVVVKVKEPRQ